MVDALNLMGGEIDWAGLPIVMAIFGVEDIETTVRSMREFIIQRRNQK